MSSCNFSLTLCPCSTRDIPDPLKVADLTPLKDYIFVSIQFIPVSN